MIIGIDTSSSCTSIAVIDDDGDVLVERIHDDPRRHAEAIGPMLADVLSHVDRELVVAVACGVGPGPYTGLRVGIAAGIAIGAAWDVPVYGLCSLDALAAEVRARRPGHDVSVACDARRSEMYWAHYDASGQRIDGPRVIPVAEVDSAAEVGVPSAVWVARRVQELLSADSVMFAHELPLDEHGADTGATADALAGAMLLSPRPLYLRRPDAAMPISLEGRA